MICYKIQLEKINYIIAPCNIELIMVICFKMKTKEKRLRMWRSFSDTKKEAIQIASI